MSIDLPISNRVRKFGYIYWHKKDDNALRELFGQAKVAEVFLDGYPLGQKRIDWKNRRISVGWRQTRKLSRQLSSLRMTLDRDGSLRVKCL